MLGRQIIDELDRIDHCRLPDCGRRQFAHDGGARVFSPAVRTGLSHMSRLRFGTRTGSGAIPLPLLDSLAQAFGVLN